MLLMGMINPLFAEGKTSYTFSGWIDATEFQSTFQIDTNLVKKTNWDDASSSEVKAIGYFYTNKSGEPVFKVTKIDIPKKPVYQPQQDDTDEVEEDDSNYQYNDGQGYDQSEN